MIIQTAGTSSGRSYGRQATRCRAGSRPPDMSKDHGFLCTSAGHVKDLFTSTDPGGSFRPRLALSSAALHWIYLIDPTTGRILYVKFVCRRGNLWPFADQSVIFDVRRSSDRAGVADVVTGTRSRIDGRSRQRIRSRSPSPGLITGIRSPDPIGSTAADLIGEGSGRA